MMAPMCRVGQCVHVTEVIAHRGASTAARENTIEAFRLAVDLGADAVELDVRRTADDHLVVHHDARLPDGRLIRELDRAELPPHVPGLGDALDACEGVWVNLEIKNERDDPDFDPDRVVARRVAEMLSQRGSDSRWLISSFDLGTIEAVRRFAPPSLRTAWLVNGVPDNATEVLRSGGHHALHPFDRLLSQAVLDKVRSAGFAVNVWTCNDPERLRELVAWGVDGVCTDVVEVARAVVDEMS